MKNVLFLLVAGLLVTGCAGIQKQNNINKLMEGHVFNHSAEEVYKAAEAEFEKMYTPIKTTGKNSGASEWLTQPSKLGEKEYQEKSRFTVTVTAKDGKQSTVVVNRESQSDFSGAWSETRQARMPVYEFNILKRLNPTTALEIENKASTMQ